MAPTEVERIATLEEARKNDKQLLHDIKLDLKRLPRRISKNIARQLEICRALQDGKYIAKPALSTGNQPDTDVSWVKKLVVALFGIGIILGGAVYQFKESSVKQATIQQQEGSK